MANKTQHFGYQEEDLYLFRETFTGDGAAVTFQLTGNVGNATFETGEWTVDGVKTAMQAYATTTGRATLYDSALPLIRNAISVSSISAAGLATLDYAPMAENFYIWYWYDTSTNGSAIEDYYRDEFVADVEASTGSDLASLINTDTTNFNGLLSASDDTVQKALETLDDLSLTPSGLTMGTGIVVGRGTAGSGAGEELVLSSDYGVTFTYAASSLKIDTPQDLQTSASPTFVTAKLSGLSDGYVPYHVADATGLADSIISVAAGGVTIGTGAAGVDYTLTFNGEDSDLTLTWLEDETVLDVSHAIRIKGGIAGAYSTGSGLELYTDSGECHIQAYDRESPAYMNLYVWAQNITLAAAGNETLILNGDTGLATFNYDVSVPNGTISLGDLADGYIPYHVSDEAGLADSLIYISSGDVYVANASIVLSASEYVNFGGTQGTGGYGIFDSAGTLYWKNSGGSWIEFNHLGFGDLADPNADALPLWDDSEGSLAFITIGDSLTVGLSTATWNPLDKSANITLSNSDMTATASNTAWKSVRATLGKSTGKWYFEVRIDVAAANYNIIGVGQLGASTATYCGGNTVSWGYNGYNGNKFYNTASTAYGNTFTAGDIVGVAVDISAGKIWWAKNNSWQASGDPAAGTGEAYSGLSGTLYPMFSPYTNTNAGTARFVTGDMSYSPPSGFTAWQTAADAQELDTVQDLQTTASPTFVTVLLSGLTDGYVPYHVADATGLADSVIQANTTNVGIACATTIARLEVEDGGTTASILVKITQDDANTYGLAIGNDTYSTTDTNGFKIKVDNSGNALVTWTAGNFTIGPDADTDALKLDINKDLYLTAGSIVLPASEYVNFGGTQGTSGYGFFDSAGTLQFKDSGGSWYDLAVSLADVEDTPLSLSGHEIDFTYDTDQFAISSISGTPADLEMTAGLKLEPDTAPYTSGAMTTDNDLIDNDTTTKACGTWWLYKWAYGFDTGSASTQIHSIVVRVNHALASAVSTWYTTNNDSFSVYKSSDNSTWTFVETFNAPPISAAVNYYFTFTCELASPDTARYWKIVSIDGNPAVTAGGASISITEIYGYGLAAAGTGLNLADPCTFPGDVNIPGALIVGASTATTIARLEVEDGGTDASILLKLTQDDANVYGLVIGNDTYSATDTEGFKIKVGDAGAVALTWTAGDFTLGPDSDTDAVKLDSNKDFYITAGNLVSQGGRKLKVTVVTGTYTALTSDDVIVGNSTTAFTITLPAASGGGRRYHVKNINTGTVTVDGDSSDTIDGDASQALAQWDAIILEDYAANKWVIL